MTDSPTLILMNLLHIGDVFCSQQIVRQMCLHNPGVRIEFVAHHTLYLYTDIAKECSNLTLVDIATHPLRRRLARAKFAPWVCLRPGVFAIHLWLGALGRFECRPGGDRYLECHFENVYKTVQHIVGHIHAVYGVAFTLPDCAHPAQLIPIIPDTHTDLFDAWRASRGQRPCVLYYNFGPRSCQSIGIREEDHVQIIAALCAARPDVDFLVPSGAPPVECRPPNLWNCEESFGCAVTASCENLCMLAKMELRCNLAVHFDIGACFFYASRHLYAPDTPSTILHLSVDDFYYERLRGNFGDSISTEDYAKKVVPVRVSADVDACIAELLARLPAAHQGA
jgi:hypothetical protein